jgi:hypothetical protein
MKFHPLFFDRYETLILQPFVGQEEEKWGQVLKREFYNPAEQYFHIFPFSRP